MMRFIANLAALASIVLLPWWAVCVVLLIFIFLFDFAEVIFYAFVLDVLYGIPEGIWKAHGFLLTALLVYIFSVWIRPYLKAI